uniref:Uncharacterized protein n=1 Tax=Tanacetum cinerariifolium TaxID=118510 RepID=A0A699J691_TANCI|nr:hypothetical protein [Tanacetum cinerariifolium]
MRRKISNLEEDRKKATYRHLNYNTSFLDDPSVLLLPPPLVKKRKSLRNHYISVRLIAMHLQSTPPPIIAMASLVNTIFDHCHRTSGH